MRIDWISLTDMNRDFSAYLYDALGEHGAKAKPAKARLGYKSASDFGDGITLLSGEERMGLHWQFSGAGLDWLGQNNAYWVLSTALQQGCKLKRVDLAHDFNNGEVSVDDIRKKTLEAMEVGVVRKRKHNSFQGSDGDTFYVGSRSSDLFARAYDKGLQLDLEEFKRGDWVRTEFEAKGDVADEFAKGFIAADNQRDYCGGVFIGWMNSMFSSLPFISHLSWGIMPIYCKVPKKDTDTRHWIETVVRQGIINYCLTIDNPIDWLTEFAVGIGGEVQTAKNNSKVKQ